MPHVVRTPRLRLVSLGAEQLDLLVRRRPGRRRDAGVGFQVPRWWPKGEPELPLARRVAQVREDPSVEPWLLRAVLDDEDRMVGHVGFHYRPAPVEEALADVDYEGEREPAAGGVTELGYTVFADHRRRGLATEAVSGLLAWAFEEAGLGAALAAVDPGNAASLGVLRKVGGFRRVGTAAGAHAVYRRDR